MKINALQGFRYFVTTVSNDKGTYNITPKLAMGSLRIAMATTYENLISTHLTNLHSTTATTASLAQVKRNHMTAIRWFMRCVSKSETSPVGDELGLQFDALVRQHLEHAKLTDRSKRDRRSLLNLWRETFKTVASKDTPPSRRERRSAALIPSRLTPFEDKLREGLKAARLTPKRAAKLAGVSTSAISRWTRGALPNTRTTKPLDQLDVVLGFQPGTLNEALQETKAPGALAQKKNAYRQRMKKLAALKPTPVEPLPQFVREWKDFLRYKTAPAPDLKRSSRAKWSTLLKEKTITAPNWFCTVGGNFVSPAASINWGVVQAFIAYLRTPAKDGGFGLTDEAAQTLAWFAVPEAIEGYFAFKTMRSDGLRHNGQGVLCRLAISLLHPVHGYLTQQSAMAERLPAEYRPADTWARMCEQSRMAATSLKAGCHDKSRNPAEPLEPLLSLSDPLQPIFEAMQRIRANGDIAPQGSKAEAIARRDELLLGLLVFNPLRVNNIVTLTYRPDGTGEVFKDTAGVWTIRLSAGRMKNRERLKNQVYTVRLPEWLGRLVDDYVTHHRDKLSRSQGGEYFFLSSSGKRFDSITNHFLRLTRRNIPTCSGFGPHAMRHLVATNWLNKHPNDFLTVAELLNDTLEVVLQNYAHLKKDAAFGRYNDYLQAYTEQPSISVK